MPNHNSIATVVLFLISFLLGIGVAIAAAFGLLVGLVFVQPYFAAFALFALAAGIALLLYCIRNQGTGTNRCSPCRCVYDSLGALIISSLVLLTSTIFTVVLALNLILAAIVAFVGATFFFFSLFLLAAILFCMLSSTRDRCPGCEE